MTATSASFPPEISAADIVAVVCEHFRISIEELVGQSRSRTAVDARQSALYLCSELTDLSPSQIGELFGGRDHTVVLHAERKVRARMTERFDVRNHILEMTAQLKLGE